MSDEPKRDDEPKRAMIYEEAKTEPPPLPVDQAFANYRAAVRTAIVVSDRYRAAVEHRDVKLAEIIHNRDMTSAAARRSNAERELNRAIIAELRKEQEP